ncbi:DUF2285 domain-containing protein [Agrobacterium vitis]|uniref:DUF2285 domain-containing protein n=1 Tax=Agrobacterium vitis TaxID=373 RepID=A0A1S2E8U5_AGRVI|nr:DUF2285 domain-containing protein [Agrobacterium vitis]MCM2449023.1 DUF2285 domain-containing protein [Agrobacterium vitis]MCM2467285.1 DUF2285 domain-containing protein [Agrobacterium vitis]MUO68810.1 DUF2285 domain-containing protein [Agrobacterium vitis]MUO79775.1 DUF2285 domain-containing protein [Agrobacterium vitis]MUO93736.1 DUF2285 domain-containing protein [Agrobacterium vitis]
MTKVKLADCPPADAELTAYDREHLKLYLRLLDAEAEGADWMEVAEVVLRLDPKRDGERARRIYAAHLARAKWMAEHGSAVLMRSSLH